MVVGAKVCELTDGFLWFVCGLYVGILTSPLRILITPLSMLYLQDVLLTHLKKCEFYIIYKSNSPFQHIPIRPFPHVNPYPQVPSPKWIICG